MTHITTANTSIKEAITALKAQVEHLDKYAGEVYSVMLDAEAVCNNMEEGDTPYDADAYRQADELYYDQRDLYDIIMDEYKQVSAWLDTLRTMQADIEHIL